MTTRLARLDADHARTVADLRALSRLPDDLAAEVLRARDDAAARDGRDALTAALSETIQR